jgi:hypothetical protein
LTGRSSPARRPAGRRGRRRFGHRFVPIWAPGSFDPVGDEASSSRISGASLERDRLGELDGRVWGPLREKLGVTEPPTGCGTRTRLCEYTRARPSTELAEELGHSPQMTLGTYARVMDELRGAPRLPAEQEIAMARERIEERGLAPVLREALG